MTNSICDSKLSFSECELEILRNAVDVAEKRLAIDKVRSPNVKEIINIVEIFLKNKKLICYGGTAINNILPKKDQFYNYGEEIPDYDFFSPNALEDAKELADIYYNEGFTEVEAKAGVHHGTYKVFVDFIPVADITQISPAIFKSFKKNAVQVDNILYTPPNALRMFMYLELSRPMGDVSRWEKVLKRISLLNKNYPINGTNCNVNSFQRIFEGKENYNKIYDITKNTPVKYLCIKDNQEFFYTGGKFVRFGNDCLILNNGSNNWSVKKYIKDKEGNIMYSSKFFIPSLEEDFTCTNEVKELKSIIKAQQQIIDKLSYQVKRLSS